MNSSMSVYVPNDNVRHIGLAICASLTVYSLLKASWLKDKLPLPPGPPSSWFGNRPLQAPLSFSEVKTLVDKYGPVFSLRSGSQVVVVVGTLQTAKEILDHDSALTADRPLSVAALEVMSGGMRLLLLSSGDRFRRFKRALQKHLGPKAIVEYEAIQRRYSRILVQDILNDPANHIAHAKKFAGSLVLSITYGKTVPTTFQDPEIQNILRTSKRLGIATRLKLNWLETFPFLRHIPFMYRELKTWHREELAFFSGQVESARERDYSFAKSLLEAKVELGLKDAEVAYLAGSMFGAGSDTQASSISIALMAAACFPQEQAKVQAELDEVVGKERAPAFEDKAQLPKLMAFILEVYRWKPVAGGGFPHRLNADVIWNGYCIPKGASIYGSHRSLSRDESVFTDSSAFIPDRWLTDEGKLRPDAVSIAVAVTFGYGRRLCPGYHLAIKSLYMTASTLLWSFNVSQDPNSPIDTEETGFKDGVAVEPLPFKVVFTPRIENLVEKL